jgi:hypothetical protein
MNRRIPQRIRSRAPVWFALGLFAALLFVYVQTLAPGMVKGDGGELQLTIATLGVPHPTGYPLYTIVGWLWIKLVPIGSVAWRVNLFSAVCGALAATLVYGSTYRLIGRVLPALAGALFFAFSPTFWALSSTTEVYALNALFVAAIFFLLLLWRDAGPHRFKLLMLMALVYGLSLSHHRTMILLAPAMLIFLVLESGALRRRGPLSAAQLVRCGLLLLGAFLLGLLPYLHVFIHLLKRDRSVADIVFNVILGGDFSFFLGFRADPLRVLWELPLEQVGVLGLIAATFGLAWLLWKDRPAACLLGVGFVSTMLFCLFYRVPDIPDFLVPATLILAICAGTSAGFLALLERDSGGATRRRQRTWGRWLRLLLEIALVLVAALSLRNFDTVRASVEERAGGIEERARSVLEHNFEPGATVLADWELATASRYLRIVEGVEADIRLQSANLWRERACMKLLQAADSVGAAYVSSEVQLTRLPDGYRLSADPPFLRITSEPPRYARLDRQLHPQLALQGVQRDGPMLVLRWQVTGSPLAEDYTTYVHFFDSDGQPIGQHDKGMGAELTCWYPPTAWPVGQVMQDLFVIPPETASIRVGAYSLHEGQVMPFGTNTSVELEP